MISREDAKVIARVLVDTVSEQVETRDRYIVGPDVVTVFCEAMTLLFPEPSPKTGENVCQIVAQHVAKYPVEVG